MIAPQHTHTHIFKCKSACWQSFFVHTHEPKKKNNDLNCCYSIYGHFMQQFFFVNQFLQLPHCQTHNTTKYEFLFLDRHCFLVCKFYKSFHIQRLQHVTSTVLHSITTVNNSGQSNQSFGILLPVENDFLLLLYAISHTCTVYAVQRAKIGNFITLNRSNSIGLERIGSDLHLS